MDDVWMSLSAIPSFLRAAMTAVIRVAASARAAFTVVALTVTPSRRSAVSGVRTTRPVPLTEIVCALAVGAGLEASRRGAEKRGLARPATRSPVARPTASQRPREPVGRLMVTVVSDIERLQSDRAGA